MAVTVHRNISVVDLMAFPKSRESIVREDKEGFIGVLYSLGFDVKRGIERRVCYHRPLIYKEEPSKVVYSARFEGFERADSSWLLSGWASEEMERHIIRKRDRELRKEMDEMSKYPKWSQMLMESLHQHYV